MSSIGFIVLFLISGQQAPSFDTFLIRLKLLPISQRSAAVEVLLGSSQMTPIVEKGSLAHFVWFGKANTVIVMGDLQRAWSHPDTMESIPCGDSSFFHRSYVVPSDARVDYQFIVDGKWCTDPRNPRITPSGFGPHSELAMPGFVSNPVLKHRLNVPHGTIDSIWFTSSLDSLRPRAVKIYKPHDYSDLSNLPSLYVNDGFEALQFEYFQNALDNLIADRTIRPLLVVFIPPVQRHNEYVGLQQRAFTKMICDELVPLIDRAYLTSHKPEDRAMMGISDGGHVSVAMVLKRPDVFLNGAGQSSTITPQLFAILENSAEHRLSHSPFKLYLDVGQYDLDYPGEDGSFLSLNREFSAELTKDEIKNVYREVNDGHEWANWRERSEDILKLFFGVK